MAEDVGMEKLGTGVGKVTSGAHEFSRDEWRRQRELGIAAAWARLLRVLIALARGAGILVAALLVVHVVLTLGGANPQNGITQFVAEWAEPLALGFQDLFIPAEPQMAVLVNYGIAALFWLLVTWIAVRILRALG